MESPATNPRWKWVIMDLINPDPEARFSAFQTLQNHVSCIDSNDVLQFLAQILDLYNSNGKNYQETSVYLLSLLNSLACQCGKSLISWYPEIIKMVLDTLCSNSNSNSTSSSILLKSCATLVSSLVNFSTDPNSDSEEEIQIVIRSLSGCLLQSLLDTKNCLSMASAICIGVLVETGRWKFAPDDLVNEVCLRITGALEEKGTQTRFHINLVCSLAERNGFLLEAYGRSLLKSAANILDDSIEEEDLEKSCSVVEMISSIIRFTDVSVLSPEVSNCIRSMTRHRFDQSLDFEKLVAETIRIAKYTLPTLSISIVEKGEDGTSESWIPCPTNAVSSDCPCNVKCYRNFDTPSPRFDHSIPSRNKRTPAIHGGLRRGNFSSKPVSETKICREGLELVYCNGGDCGDSNSKSSGSNFSTSSAFSSSDPSVKVAELPVSGTANQVSAGEVRQEISSGRRGLRNFNKQILRGLAIAGFSVFVSMVVGGLIDNGDLLCVLTPT